MRRKEPNRSGGTAFQAEGTAGAKVELGTGSQKSMTCWVALGQAGTLQPGLCLLIPASLSFCISGSCERRRGWGEDEREAGISYGSWAALAEVWKVQPKSAGL